MEREKESEGESWDIESITFEKKIELKSSVI